MPFPNPATHGPDEAALVRTILANHAADLPKLVYADWLEERNDPRGPFLRAFVEATTDGSPYPDPAGFPQPWLDLMGVPALIACREHAIPLSPAELLSMARPAIRITAERVGDEAIPVGASKFGGGADVPDGFEWPELRGIPLTFLAQFDLAELATSPACDGLPNSGLLSILYGLEGSTFRGLTEAGRLRNYQFDAGEKFRGAQLDPEVFFSCRLSFTETLTYPQDGFWNVLGEFMDSEASSFGLPNSHQLLGWEFFYDYPPVDEFHHLLTLQTDELGPGWIFADMGWMYLGVDANALRDGKVMVSECELQG